MFTGIPLWCIIVVIKGPVEVSTYPRGLEIFLKSLWCFYRRVYMKPYKVFTNIDEQIDILKKRGLIFYSEETAKLALKRHGYYNIINGYKDPFVADCAEEKFKDNVSFEQIYDFYILDKKIRLLLMETMLEVESQLKTATAYVIAKVYSSDDAKYLKRTNYKLGRKKNGKFLLDELLYKFEKIKNDHNDPFWYYKNHYDNIPPWILMNGLTFGNLANFIKLQKSDVKKQIISMIYDIPSNFVSDDIVDLFMDSVFVYLAYRNASAHGDRIYKFSPTSSFRYSALLHPVAKISEMEYRHGVGMNDLNILIHSLMLFNDNSIHENLSSNFFQLLMDHIKKYPNSHEYLYVYLPLNKYRQ